MMYAECDYPILQPRRVSDEVLPPLPDRCIRPILEQAISKVFMVAGSDLWSGTRGKPRAALARQVAMYLAHVACGLTMTEVGQIFARDRTTVRHACGLVEDMRDEPSFDRSVELLEGVMRLLSPVFAGPLG